MMTDKKHKVRPEKVKTGEFECTRNTECPYGHWIEQGNGEWLPSCMDIGDDGKPTPKCSYLKPVEVDRSAYAAECTGWGIRCPFGKFPELLPFTIRRSRKHAIEALAENMANWKRLYRMGYRAVKVVCVED